MVYSEKLLNIIALKKCEDHYTKKANIGFALLLPIRARAITQVLRG